TAPSRTWSASPAGGLPGTLPFFGSVGADDFPELVVDGEVVPPDDGCLVGGGGLGDAGVEAAVDVAGMNGFGKLRRCTEKRSRVVDFYLYLFAAIVTLRILIRRATPRCRWDGRPTTRRLK
ncbi:hypothetical protein ABZT17_45055, partial [Streptomyces sp. NPDC005648]